MGLVFYTPKSSIGLGVVVTSIIVTFVRIRCMVGLIECITTNHGIILNFSNYNFIDSVVSTNTNSR